MITRTNLNDIQKTGRLGNQLWAIASAIGIAENNNIPFYFPNWNYQRWFSHELPSNSDIYSGRFKIYNEQSSYYEDIKLNAKYDWDLRGYFQSYKYFDEYKNLIYQYLTPNFETNEFPKNAVSIHVRRGDYLNLSHIHSILTEEYYKEAMSFFPDKRFLVFSDDIEWVKYCGWFDHELCYFVEQVRKEYLTAPQELMDLFYMSRCDSNIIANSSFSWWAAYLNNHQDKIVVAPKVWVNDEDRNDRLPEKWVKL